MTTQSLESTHFSLFRPVLRLLRAWGRHMLGAWRTRCAQREARDAFRNTLRLDDHLLDDIGVTRDEVEWAARLPLDENASHALFARAKRRREGD